MLMLMLVTLHAACRLRYATRHCLTPPLRRHDVFRYGMLIYGATMHAACFFRDAFVAGATLPLYAAIFCFI